MRDEFRNGERGDTPSAQPPRRVTDTPWRTEGVRDADGPGAPRRGPWWRLALWILVGYLVAFGLLSLQDGLVAPPQVPYTEFTDQVEAGNVSEVFARGDSIQGTLRQPQPLPGQPPERTYQQFTTERPTFAQDDLLAELERTGVTVRATPVVEQRGLLSNLLIALSGNVR